jgi:hypothetical protein
MAGANLHPNRAREVKPDRATASATQLHIAADAHMLPIDGLDRPYGTLTRSRLEFCGAEDDDPRCFVLAVGLATTIARRELLSRCMPTFRFRSTT